MLIVLQLLGRQVFQHTWPRPWHAVAVGQRFSFFIKIKM